MSFKSAMRATLKHGGYATCVLAPLAIAFAVGLTPWVYIPPVIASAVAIRSFSYKKNGIAHSTVQGLLYAGYALSASAIYNELYDPGNGLDHGVTLPFSVRAQVDTSYCWDTRVPFTVKDLSGKNYTITIKKIESPETDISVATPTGTAIVTAHPGHYAVVRADTTSHSFWWGKPEKAYQTFDTDIRRGEWKSGRKVDYPAHSWLSKLERGYLTVNADIGRGVWNPRTIVEDMVHSGRSVACNSKNRLLTSVP